MPPLDSKLDPASDAYENNRAAVLRQVARLRSLEERTRSASANSKPRFDRRGQILPRERIGRLLDAGSPWLELASLAGYQFDDPDPERSIPGASVITGIGYVSGIRSAIMASDSGINAGAIGPMGMEKMVRVQEIALRNKLPFVYLVESAGANLLKYNVAGFVLGGSIFRNLARLSAAGLPVVTIVHGPSTAGGAYFPGLSDYVVMVKGRARAFLAGPALLKAATGEISGEEELGGAEMHSSVSGSSEYLAVDDVDAIRIARDVMSRLNWSHDPLPSGKPPRYSSEELLGVMSADGRKPVDMREVIARIVDDSDFLEFKAGYGMQTITGHASLEDLKVGIVTNNGPLDPAGATKATHFIQACCQSGVPLLYLQNTTGYIVGRESEAAGMIKHGSKMIQAVTNADVPQLTLMCGASYGAGNYGMCGRAFDPHFVFSWPNAQTAVMGPQQAALTMAFVMEEGARRSGRPVDEDKLAAMKARIVETFESQISAFHTSSRLLDDGVIDPRDTRRVLAYALSVAVAGKTRSVRPIQFSVARP